jgi:hypothetical protein
MSGEDTTASSLFPLSASAPRIEKVLCNFELLSSFRAFMVGKNVCEEIFSTGADI